MRTQLLDVTPTIPAELGRLPELAGNLFFSWHRPTRALFEALDPQLWAQSRGNPKRLLRTIDQEALNRAAADPALQARYREVLQTFDAYLQAPPLADAPQVAYFCAEYGLTQSFPIYSGGLGVLAGDHCKAASDERLHFTGVGLLYAQGYFSQMVDSDGLQHAEYHDYDPRDLPVEPVRDAQGQWLAVVVRIANRDVRARLWRSAVGRISVVMLDANCPENAPADRAITHRLYGGDEALRIRQEMLLGIGGARALRLLGVTPAVWHINEGHAGFLILELLREHVARGLEFDAALEAVAAQCAFTTHTPVAAGHDAFSHELFLACFGDYLRELGAPVERILELGRAPNAPHAFNMTRLALSGARHVNGVSRIHGQVSAQLCADHWPELPASENPVGFITNGVHVPTFLHQAWAEFFDETLGDEWRERLSDADFWNRLAAVPDRAFWQTAQRVKADMIKCVRERLRREYIRKLQSSMQWRHVARFLDPDKPDVLTIGFARRFATYKRAALLLKDRARLARLVNDPDRPIVFLFAGKAHPADEPGKAVLREIRQAMLQPEFMGRIIFVEDYDIQLARWLVSGCDVWLNNPVAPLEASGTSGIKAAINGRLNLSVLDGWWAEAFDQQNGWGIPPVDVHDAARRDALEAELIFDTLEEEVRALYYTRGASGLPDEWIRRCKHAMISVLPRFNMRRVVADYTRGIYQPAALHGRRLAAGDFAGARALAAWKAAVRAAWPKVQLRALAEPPRELPRQERLRLRVAVQLGELQAQDLCVEFRARRLLPETEYEWPALASFRGDPARGLWRAEFAATDEHTPDGARIFALDAPPPGCGQYATEVRVFPRHELLAHPLELGLMKWLPT
ncbi:MAG: alpha-glucan family phosphorylase [Steroidobacteraceae bacterium]|nr:alpha-glucan family phosphorylase [Steroidobacteraceae bacterium]MDW8260603.1 alpha-glucan family phosphorylase [Gammaproteobacteria bacterium]